MSPTRRPRAPWIPLPRAWPTNMPSTASGVNCVRPGLILTDIWERSIGPEAAIALGKTGSMLKRIGQPEENRHHGTVALLGRGLIRHRGDLRCRRGARQQAGMSGARGQRTTDYVGREPMSGIKVMSLGDAEVYEDETVISRRLVRRAHGSEEISLNVSTLKEGMGRPGLRLCRLRRDRLCPERHRGVDHRRRNADGGQGNRLLRPARGLLRLQGDRGDPMT